MLLPWRRITVGTLDAGEYEIHEPLEVDSTGRQNGVWCAKFSPGGNEIICGTSSCHLLVYDVERKRMVERVPAHDDDINSVAYADRAYRPHLILTASDDHLVKVCLPPQPPHSREMGSHARACSSTLVCTLCCAGTGVGPPHDGQGSTACGGAARPFRGPHPRRG